MKPDRAGYPLIGGSTPSRRGFIMAAGAVTVAVAFGADAREAFADAVPGPFAPGAFTPNAWVSIGADDVVSIYFALAEMGQGIMTTLPLLIAEEMDADWSKVRVLQSPSDVKTYGVSGTLGTFGSESTRSNFERLRLVGAQTRKILLAVAAERLGAPVGELSTTPGRVAHKASGRSVSYGALAKAGRLPDPLPQATKADLKAPADFRYLGKSMPRLDVPSKVDGSAVYGIDVQLPGMLYGSVLHAPVQGETPDSIDDAAAKAVPGVLHIVLMPHAVGVIAETVQASRKGAAALKITWSSKAPARAYSGDAILNDYRAIAADPAHEAVVMQKTGDAAAAISGAQRVFQAEYLSDHVAHLTMEPMNATARVDGQTVEIWASNQSPSSIQRVVGELAGLPPEQIVVHSTLLGGGFGRRYEADFAADAYGMAKAAPGRPVKVIWTREEDVRNDPYRPLTAQRIEVGLGADGQIVGWRHRVVAGSYLARLRPAVFQKIGGQDGVVAGGGGVSYPVGAHLVDYVHQDRGVAVGALRGISSGYMRFAIESAIDELAALKGVEPLAYRLDMLKDNPRAVACLKAVAQMSDWSRLRPDRALGLAYSDDMEGRLALVAEISQDAKTGAIRVHSLWCAVDAGLPVQPVNLAAQIEGGLLFGLGPALFEKVTIKDGAVAESNFGNYRVLRMSETPEVQIQIIATDNPPTGVGEAGVLAVAPAIANAFARLSGGKRLRHLPMSADRAKAAVA